MATTIVAMATMSCENLMGKISGCSPFPLGFCFSGNSPTMKNATVEAEIATTFPNRDGFLLIRAVALNATPVAQKTAKALFLSLGRILSRAIVAQMAT